MALWDGQFNIGQVGASVFAQEVWSGISLLHRQAYWPAFDDIFWRAAAAAPVCGYMET